MFGNSRFMLRDKQLARSTCTKQRDSDEDLSYYRCMDSVHSDGVDWMEIGQWLARQPAERNVAAEILHGTAGFDPSHNIAFRQMLVFEAHLGLRENAGLSQTS